MSGSKPGERRGGRQKGTPNKKTAEQKAAIKAAVEKVVGQLEEPFEGDSYAFLATLYKDKNLPLHVRLDAAKTAVAYERPRLSNVEMTTRSLDKMADEDFFRVLRGSWLSAVGRSFWRLRSRQLTWLSATRARHPSLTTGTFSRATVAHLENSKNLDCFSTAPAKPSRFPSANTPIIWNIALPAGVLTARL
jgi:hypothetical protein